MKPVRGWQGKVGTEWGLWKDFTSRVTQSRGSGGLEHHMGHLASASGVSLGLQLGPEAAALKKGGIQSWSCQARWIGFWILNGA